MTIEELHSAFLRQGWHSWEQEYFWKKQVCAFHQYPNLCSTSEQLADSYEVERRQVMSIVVGISTARQVAA